MFLGIAAQPIPESDFNGKIFLERVARVEEFKSTVYNKKNTDDATTNGPIKNGE